VPERCTSHSHKDTSRSLRYSICLARTLAVQTIDNCQRLGYDALSLGSPRLKLSNACFWMVCQVCSKTHNEFRSDRTFSAQHRKGLTALHALQYREQEWRKEFIVWYLHTKCTHTNHERPTNTIHDAFGRLEFSLECRNYRIGTRERSISNEHGLKFYKIDAVPWSRPVSMSSGQPASLSLASIRGSMGAEREASAAWEASMRSSWEGASLTQ